MNYYEKIDPIGEDMSKEIENNIDIEHEIICNINTSLHKTKREIRNLDKLIEHFKTYSSNTYIIEELSCIKMRLNNNLKEVETNFNKYNEYNGN